MGRDESSEKSGRAEQFCVGGCDSDADVQPDGRACRHKNRKKKKEVLLTDDTQFGLMKPISLTPICKLHSFQPSLNMTWIYGMIHSLCTKDLHIAAEKKVLDWFKHVTE